jgi:DNA-binding transcriptional LysR family regulator
MRISTIRYLLVLLEELNFGHAARRCNISQPSLTAAIQRLEREIGGQLFTRKPTVRPTPLALALKPHCRKLIAAVELMEAEARRQGKIEDQRDRAA